jgi:hypothetical protein
MTSSSFASVPAVKVSAACTRWLVHHEAKIANQRESLITAMMKRRFFRPADRAQARERLIARGVWGDWANAGLYAFYTESRVRSLRILANIALVETEHAVINLTAADAEHLVNSFSDNSELS